MRLLEEGCLENVQIVFSLRRHVLLDAPDDQRGVLVPVAGVHVHPAVGDEVGAGILAAVVDVAGGGTQGWADQPAGALHKVEAAAACCVVRGPRVERGVLRVDTHRLCQMKNFLQST